MQEVGILTHKSPLIDSNNKGIGINISKEINSKKLLALRRFATSTQPISTVLAYFLEGGGEISNGF